MKWAESNGYKGSFSEICKLEGLKEYILKELAAVAQKNKLRGFEYIKGIVLDPIPFDIERDLVTATMKKRRNNMLKYYQVRQTRLLIFSSRPFLLILSSSNSMFFMCSPRSIQYTKSWKHRRMLPKLIEMCVLFYRKLKEWQ
jgi:hypothetical protein